MNHLVLLKHMIRFFAISLVTTNYPVIVAFVTGDQSLKLILLTD